MAQLSLTNKEEETLTKALEAYLSDLRMEIADTDAHDFREGLKQGGIGDHAVALERGDHEHSRQGGGEVARSDAR